MGPPDRTHARQLGSGARARRIRPETSQGRALLKPARTTSVTRRIGGARLPLSRTLRTRVVACGRPPGFRVVRYASHVGADESLHVPAGRGV
jgi:hypothetical protein